MENPDLFVGLISPIGVPKEGFLKALRDELSLYGYELEDIRLSRLLHDIYSDRDLRGALGVDRYKNHMAAGNDFCRAMNDTSAMAGLAILKIASLRNENKKPTVYLFNSLKRQEEIRLLRRVYRDAFIGISLHSSRELRVDNLAREFASTSDDGSHRAQAEQVIEIDESEDVDFGQDIRQTVPMADLFLTTGTADDAPRGIERFLRILFESPTESPTRDELAMFHAKASATRSVDLSRQVGAVIAGTDGQIISTGCNEVPKAGGGLYWPGDRDMRDFRLGYDSNVRLRNDLLVELFERLSDAEWFKEPYAKMSQDERLKKALDKTTGMLKGTRVESLIEYGRIVHAEMAAITEAARSGTAIGGLTLYCTTFPCHMCARHILASGILRVVYIEPYPKSLAKDLYSDSILIDPPYESQNHINFTQFKGIAPRYYLRAFERGRRKDEGGNVMRWSKRSSKPHIETDFSVFLQAEDNYILSFREQLQITLESIGRETNGYDCGGEKSS